MTSRDEVIGANLQRLRDDMSQKDLADRMRERGWKWSQATVWSIEKGERPIRLAEAEDLINIFGLDGIHELTVTPIVTLYWKQLYDAQQDEGAVVTASNRLRVSQYRLAATADELVAAGIEIPALEEGELDSVLRETPAAISRRLPFKKSHSLVKPQVVGRYLSMFDETLERDFESESEDGKHQEEA